MAALALSGLGVMTAATADHDRSLPGSFFEIDDDANMTVQHGEPWLDWATVDESQQTDTVDPKNDDSFTGGSKEDTEVPSISTGSIPPNKSDLKSFGVYLETNESGRFLNLYWSRVQNPSGTTNMDFELNQSTVISANGVTPVRTSGDILIQYDLAQGGTNPELWVSYWLDADDTGTCEASNSKPCWGQRTNFSDVGDATGSINSTAILAGDSGGIGAQDPFTFGEAQVDFDALAGGTERCISSGSAYLKSRSSDSFTAAMKDFIAPTPINISNCGKVIIRKVTDPVEDPAETMFTFTPAGFQVDPGNGGTPAVPAAFQLGHGEDETFTNVVQGTGSVTETETTGWDLTSISCSASSGVTPVVEMVDGELTGKVTFTIDDAADIVDCTFTNTARGTIVVEKVINDGYVAEDPVDFSFTSTTLTPSPFTLTPSGTGADGKDTKTFSDLAPGSYDVDETVPMYWDEKSAVCVSDLGEGEAGTVDAIDLDAGETITCTFTNEVQKGSLLIVKTAKHAADDDAEDLPLNEIPHAGVNFTVTGGSTPAEGTAATTGSDGTVCVSGLQVSGFAGNYTVKETVPAGYAVVGSDTQSGLVVTNVADCGEGVVTATFQNMPLTDITVSVNSQIVGGTASTMSCVLEGETDELLDSTSTSTAADDTWGDGSGTADDLLPGTYVCTIVVDP